MTTTLALLPLFLVLLMMMSVMIVIMVIVIGGESCSILILKIDINQTHHIPGTLVLTLVLIGKNMFGLKSKGQMGSSVPGCIWLIRIIPAIDSTLRAARCPSTERYCNLCKSLRTEDDVWMALSFPLCAFFGWLENIQHMLLSLKIIRHFRMKCMFLRHDDHSQHCWQTQGRFNKDRPSKQPHFWCDDTRSVTQIRRKFITSRRVRQQNVYCVTFKRNVKSTVVVKGQTSM